MADASIHQRTSGEEWRDKIVVNLREEVRSSVYRAALNRSRANACGFLLGCSTPSESPAIEFALLSGTPLNVAEFCSLMDRLQLQFKAAEQTAKFAGLNVVGLFIAQDLFFGDHSKLLVEASKELALDMHLPYLMVFPTTGFETLWASRCYLATDFPDGELSYRITRGKLSIQPMHNPKRVRARWRQFLAESTCDREHEHEL